MKFHGIDSQGVFYDERVTSLPPWLPEYEGRIVYNMADDTIYFASSTGWETLWSNLSIFKYILVGTSVIEANTTADSCRIEAGNGMYIEADPLTKKIIISLAGPSSEGTYLHTQSTPATAWYVNHNLNNKYAAVSVFNESDQRIIPNTITFIDASNLLITFSDPQAGKARIICGVMRNGVEYSGYTYSQLSASTTWNISHNLDQIYTIFSFINESDQFIIPDSITFTDANNMVATFSDAQAGRARIVCAIDKNPSELGSYTHIQAVDSTTWNVTHNLNNKYAAVTVIDDTGYVIIPDGISFTDANNLTITLSDAISGYARVIS